MKFNKLALAAIGAASLVVAGPAAADAYPDFTVNPSAYSAAASFTADKITGNYAEVITFDGLGNFFVSIKFEAGQFVSNDGVDPVKGTGLTNDYGLYGLFMGQGVVGMGATGPTFNLSSGLLNVYADDLNNTTFTAPANGGGAWTPVNGGDDVLLAVGPAVTGLGVTQPCQGNLCGSFTQTTGFGLTAAGASFFTAPVPFYNLSIQTGQLNQTIPTGAGTLSINGSLDVVFQRVPEPASLALVGLALAGVGLARRKKA